MTLEETTIDLLKKLIRNACVNDLTADSGEEVRNAETLEEFFAGTDVQVRRFEPHPGRVSVAFTVPGSEPSAEPLTLLGHTDVVPVDEDKWTQKPFGAEVVQAEDGARIYGRGATDMLFITAAMAAVTREVAVAAQNGTPPRGALTFVACADEEARGGLGAGWIAENEPEAFSWRNCLSETGGSHIPVQDEDADADALVVVVGEKGAAQRRITIHGDAGHGSAPYGRELTVGLIGEVARRLAAIEPDVKSDDLWQGYVRSFRFDPETEAALIAGGNYEAFGPLARYSHAMSHLTVSPTVLRAGGAINVLPSTAYVELDIRPLPGQEQGDVDKLLLDSLGDLAERVEIEHLITEDATVSPASGPLYDAIVDTFHEFFPHADVVPTIAAGGSDLRFGRRLGGVGYGFALHAAGRGFGEVLDQLHSHDEFVHVEDVELTARAYRSLVRRFLGV
ncbi:M20/M25/M40 family metallo-hydrolase [Corynebacterium sp. p3-SID1145]|uniref:M20/M25/M40 family metallo-hydrolase n=1 Tax=unclassified Corynebacterium TaxID=2624378 RepID=UPI0021A9D923|nr:MULTISPECIES: M20/M25/M40 family metallo-hydrolase [unclassified Corynebacterium]MCT1451736.1 M20/M25/M40 family metallo-hydrolase [Corynebacterium sp. p3-SID1145]MCT1460833.1 M20/M25/M40 family metallo-hydrolase [Corynebacterium sp. p3-SID1140]